ncbi:MAG: TonB-dependent receptor domain-containing protein, partial [Acidobacteriota bacterium]
MKKVFMFVLALTLAVFATSAAAQTITTGSIEGSVTDPNGAAVPGLTVTATGPQTLVPRSSTSDDSGHYRISALSPGTYTVIIEANKGFAKFEKSNIGVNLDKTSSVDIQLSLATTQVNVTVTATAGSALDVTNNTTGSNVSTEQFSNFPTQRTVQSLYSIAPTVARSGLRDASGRDRDPSVAGSSGPENNYILDGVNTTDPAFGGSGANLPFEFVQEVQVKTGAYGAENGRSTGGIFNVITKDGTNEFHGDAFGYFTAKSFVRQTRQFPFVGSAPNGFSELDAGIDVGGPIIKNKLTFFAAFNPQQRKNFFLTQTFHAPVSNQIKTPFYSGKLKWQVNQNNTMIFSTFGDFTKQTGFLFGGSGFGTDPAAFRGTQETGGHNYTARLNSTISPNWIGEFAFGLHFQRANTLPESDLTIPLISDSFAVVRGGVPLTPVHSAVVVSAATGTGDFVNGTGGSLNRGLLRGPGFGLFSNQERNRWEGSARFQNVFGNHTLKYGFEYGKNIYKILTLSTGPNATFSGIGVTGYRIANNFGVCQTQTGNTTIVCPVASLTSRIQALITAGVNLGGPTSVSTNSAVISSISTNPFLIRTSTRVRDFELTAPDGTRTNMEAFYVQDDFKLTKNVQLNGGVRWDYQQSYGRGNFSYIKLNSWWDNLQPRLGVIWDFTGKGKGKVFVNYAKYIETPLPLDLNVRAGSDTTQKDINLNVDTINAPSGSIVVANFGNLGGTHTPLDPGLKPQDVKETTAGFEYEIKRDFVLGVRGIYRWQGQVIEDGSFDDGENYFIFNPGRRGDATHGATTEDSACQGD